MARDWDVIVAGAGTAGMPVAIHAARRGARVLVIELADRIGGTLHVSGGQMAAAGVRHVIYTDVARDGMLSGVNVRATRELARASGLGVIASGGVASLDDIRALKRCEPDGVEGVIIGMALYRGAIRLQDAIVEAS